MSVRMRKGEPWGWALLLALGGGSPVGQTAAAGVDTPPPQQSLDTGGQGRAQSDEQAQAHPQGAPASPAAEEPPHDRTSELEHVAPEPPQHQLPAMSPGAMTRMMQMNDTAAFGQILVDQAEWRHSSGSDAAVWEGQGWYGGDYNKLWVKTEGEHTDGITQDARVDVLWDRIVSRWWSLQAGAREDFGAGPSRTWAAIGLQGIAPYWFDVEATFYVGEQGWTAARVKVEYDLFLTQRLILQPEVETNLYGKSDPARQLGSGLSELDGGVRLRYEVRRELAPYIGLAWRRQFGGTADLVRAAGRSADERQLAVGLRAWF
jgi:copper resistance protein B